MMSFSRPIQWYHSYADPICPDGTFKYIYIEGLKRICHWRSTSRVPRHHPIKDGGERVISLSIVSFKRFFLVVTAWLVSFIRYTGMACPYTHTPYKSLIK